MEIQILQYAYDERAALETLLQTDHNLDITDISTVYYPYLRYRYEITVGRKNRLVRTKKMEDCIIDRVYGTVYVADGKSEYLVVDAEEDEILDIVQDMEYCDKHAHDFTLKNFIENAKLLLVPKMRILERDEFYKKYYVVECISDRGYEYYILLDAVDCSMAILDHEKYLDKYDEFQVGYNNREYIAELRGTDKDAAYSDDEYYEDDEEYDDSETGENEDLKEE